MLDTFRKIRDFLDARERRNTVLLFGMMLVMALLEVIDVASMMLFTKMFRNKNTQSGIIRLNLSVTLVS